MEEPTSTTGLAAAKTSIPFKFTVSQSRRRSRLGIPLRLKALRAVVASSFPELKGQELCVSYVDDEDDEISVLSDEELEEARQVFIKLGRVLSFLVSPSPKKSPVVPSATPAPPSPSATSSISPPKACNKAKIHTQIQTDIVLENRSQAQLLPNNTLVSPKAGVFGHHFPTASIPGLTVSRGKWMYEVILGSDGLLQIGWADASFSCQPWKGDGVGDDEHSWAMDGKRLLKWHKGTPVPFGRRWGANGWRQWQAGDVIGCVYDADNGEISFLSNGDALGLAFCIPAHTSLRPAVSMTSHQKLRFALEASTLRFLVAGAAPIANALLPPSIDVVAPRLPHPSPTIAVPITLPVVTATPVTVAMAMATPVLATRVQTAQPMKFGLHPGPFILANRTIAANGTSNCGYLTGFVCDVGDKSVCSQNHDAHHTWWHCANKQYDVCRACFLKYIVPADAAPPHFSVVPLPPHNDDAATE